MKNLLLGLCLVGLTFACKGTDKMNVDDAGNANMPAADCCASEEMSECSGDMKAECSASASECSGEAKSECSATATECSGEKTECSGEAKPECSGAVCPVTGKPIN